MRIVRALCLGGLMTAGLAVLGASCGCAHVKGTVVDERGRPLTSAELSVGRPDGIAVYATHKVDDRGAFDFYISPTDETSLYVYDTSAASMTERLIDQGEISDHMRLVMPRYSGQYGVPDGMGAGEVNGNTP